MSQESMCRSFVTLQAMTSGKDASGGIVNSYADVSGYQSIAADIQPASGNVRMQYAHMQTTVSHTIYLTADVPAVAGSRFTATYDDGTDHVFLFKGRRPPAPGYDQWPCIVDCEEQIQS